MRLEFFVPFLLLLVYGLPIFLVARWAMRVRRALESRPVSTDLPSREQFNQIADRLDSMMDELESLRERQAFVERLLAAPKSASSAPAPGGGSDFA